jgi:hypothetical protein
MLADMGMITADTDPGWRDQAGKWFTGRLRDPDGIALSAALGFTAPSNPFLRLKAG